MNSNFLTCCFFSILLCSIASAEITYNLADPGVPFHTLSGTITITDEALQSGFLNSDEVTRWQITVTGDDVNFSISEQSPQVLLRILGGGWVVSAQTITLDVDNFDPCFEFLVSSKDPGSTGYARLVQSNSDVIQIQSNQGQNFDFVTMWISNTALPIFAVRSISFGDINCDGNVDLLDVAPFVEVLSNGLFQDEADVNQDGFVNLLDVEPFVAIIGGG